VVLSGETGCVSTGFVSAGAVVGTVVTCVVPSVVEEGAVVGVVICVVTLDPPVGAVGAELQPATDRQMVRANMR
jgi:hypothetical protein